MNLSANIRTQYYDAHFGKHLDEVEKIIKENFTEYYSSTMKAFNKTFLYRCNIFIMKKNDFIRYGEFVFGVLLEFDRRHNFQNDNDIKNYIKSQKKAPRTKAFINNMQYQSRLEGFLMERISNIFYQYNFKNILEIETNGI